MHLSSHHPPPHIARPARAPAHPDLPANFPTNRQVGELASRKVGERTAPFLTSATAPATLPPHPPGTRRLTRAPAHCRRSASRRPAACRHPTAGEHQRTLAAHPARSPAPYRFTRTTNPYRLPPPAPAALPHALSLPAHSPPYPGVNHQPRTPTQNLCYHLPPHRAGPCCLGRPRSPAYLASPHPAPPPPEHQRGRPRPCRSRLNPPPNPLLLPPGKPAPHVASFFFLLPTHSAPARPPRPPPEHQHLARPVSRRRPAQSARADPLYLAPPAGGRLASASRPPPRPYRPLPCSYARPAYRAPADPGPAHPRLPNAAKRPTAPPPGPLSPHPPHLGLPELTRAPTSSSTLQPFTFHLTPARRTGPPSTYCPPTAGGGEAPGHRPAARPTAGTCFRLLTWAGPSPGSARAPGHQPPLALAVLPGGKPSTPP